MEQLREVPAESVSYWEGAQQLGEWIVSPLPMPVLALMLFAGAVALVIGVAIVMLPTGTSNRKLQAGKS